MRRNRPLSPQACRLLGAFAAEPSQWRHGYDLMTEVGVSSGSLYPILARLADRGLLESSWDTPTEGRPPRHLYRLTTPGQQEAARLATVALSAARSASAVRPRPTARAAGGA
ncbi:DNA-binding PadR family transcriptional regulator [Phycicoccus badiiscoriae]|uniref:DNA-binding PadR family transcriptional regulator n=1 Tax=Pedococcus badiiscoriae TaxID=642776 RepID=A0A852WNM2_9MICO|nr:PadR family transcriptional regulator [Pedococcus badiiscoriae]NYG06852.1 DNA-binding PadR family transcriptional regulator [Pedococcus badiiscoriae]